MADAGIGTPGNLSLAELKQIAQSHTTATEKPDGKASSASRIRGTFKLLPGLLLFVAIAIWALLIQQHYGLPATLMALLIGISFKGLVSLVNKPAYATQLNAGRDFATKTVLRLGVALLGFRLTFDQIVALGLLPVVISVAVVTLTLVLGYYLGKKLGLAPEFSMIASGATAICGASAALAITSAFPKSEKRESQTVFAIMIVTLMSSAAMLLYPVIARLSGFDATQAGLLFGATIHDVAQVVGAGLIFGDGAVETAAYSKLLRVALLAPVVIAIASIARSLGFGHPRKEDCTTVLCTLGNLMPPGFLLVFAAIVMINSLLPMPEVITTSAIFLSKVALLMALAALAMKIEIKQITEGGIAPVILLVLNTLFVFILAYAIISFSY